MKKLIVLVIILAGIGVFGIKFYSTKKSDRDNLTLYGNIDIKQVNLAFRTGGRIENLKVDEGDVIKKGDLIAVLDNEPILNKLNQAKAQMEIAKLDSDNEITFYKRNKRLCREKILSVQKCDDIKRQRDRAYNNYKYVKAIYDEVKTTYNDCSLYSPSDGVILVKVQENGAMVNAGTPIYTLSLNKLMFAKVYIEETKLGKIKLGSPVEIYTDSTDKVYKGHVGFISPVAEFTPKTIETASLRTDLVYRLRVVIDDADDYLKQGMPITAKINIK